MTLAHRDLGCSLLVAGALLLACNPSLSEVETSPTSGPDTTTSGPSTVDSDTGGATMDGPDDTGPSFDPVCGDGIVEVPEQCDLGDLNNTGMYCTDECRNNVCGDGYVGPGEACDDGNDSNEDLCTTDCGPTSCGDGVIQGTEQCDEGKDNSPTGACLPSCLDASCGDQFIHEGVETCDSDDIGTQSCTSLGFSGGVLLCAGNCMEYDTSNCYACGDDSLDPGEDCDGALLNGQTCVSLEYDAGTLACSPSCTFDASGCQSFACGNGVIDGADECDGAALGGQTCVTQSFDGGNLSCSMGCTFDTSDCYVCGDGNIDMGEQCDGANIGGANCSAFVMPGDTVSGGAPSCDAPTCQLTEGTCTFCGDGMIEGAESCETGNLGGATCQSLGMGFDGGTLSCMNCAFNTGGCTDCGDGVAEGSEVCDGVDFDGATCATLVGAGSTGTLLCNAACTMIDQADCCALVTQPCLVGGDCCGGNCHPVNHVCQ